MGEELTQKIWTWLPLGDGRWIGLHVPVDLSARDCEVIVAHLKLWRDLGIFGPATEAVPAGPATDAAPEK